MAGLWISAVSTTNKTDYHDLTELTLQIEYELKKFSFCIWILTKSRTSLVIYKVSKIYLRMLYINNYYYFIYTQTVTDKTADIM